MKLLRAENIGVGAAKCLMSLFRRPKRPVLGVIRAYFAGMPYYSLSE